MTATDASVTLDTCITRSGDVLFQDVGGEAVLLDLASEQYFGLDPVGTRIWGLIDGATPLSAILATLCEEFDAGAQRIEADLLDLVATLMDAGLVAKR